MRRLVTGLGAALLLFTSTAGVAAEPMPTDPGVHARLNEVRAATRAYFDVGRAIADGYQPTDHCVEGMGFHYVNSKLAEDLKLEYARPEILIYAPSPDGPRLVAVEYFVADVGQPPPVLFDRQFDGPMDGHGPGMPRHYDQHVWAWQANPDGTFTGFNPNVRCG